MEYKKFFERMIPSRYEEVEGERATRPKGDRRGGENPPAKRENSTRSMQAGGMIFALPTRPSREVPSLRISHLHVHVKCLFSECKVHANGDRFVIPFSK